MSTPFMPPSDPSTPDLRSIMQEVRRQIRMLAPTTKPDPMPGQQRTELVFSYHGPVTALDESGSYVIKDFDATINNLVITAGTAGTGNSTFNLNVNGVNQYVVVLPGGQDFLAVEDLLVDVEEWDRVSVDFSAVGAGLSTVVVHLQVVASDDSAYT